MIVCQRFTMRDGCNCNLLNIPYDICLGQLCVLKVRVWCTSKF